MVNDGKMRFERGRFGGRTSPKMKRIGRTSVLFAHWLTGTPGYGTYMDDQPEDMPTSSSTHFWKQMHLVVPTVDYSSEYQRISTLISWVVTRILRNGHFEHLQ